MKITYDFNGSSNTYLSYDTNLNFLLSKEDNFLNLGVLKNTSKFQGYYINDLNNETFFKTIDEFVIENANITQIKYDGFKVIRKFNLGHKGYEDIFYLSSDGIVYSSNYNGEIILDLDCRQKEDLINGEEIIVSIKNRE